MKLTKQFVYELDRLVEVHPVRQLERVNKVTEMVAAGKTDGKVTQIIQAVTRDYDDRDFVVTGYRWFVDQAAAEEFQDWWVGMLARYGIHPISTKIEDFDS